jgi:GTP cyclohydrolase I
MSEISKTQARLAVETLMKYIGENTCREGLIETPDRVIRSFETLYGGYAMSPEEVFKTFDEGSCDQMVMLKNIEFYSTCEHHMIPFHGHCTIAYIPNNKVIGVSKLSRLLEIFARRMQIQERIGDQITKALMEHLDCYGAMCVIEAQHLCMTARGVQKKDAVMVTSSLEGCFSDPTVRAEFYTLKNG